MMGGKKFRRQLRTCKLIKGTVWTTEYFSGGDAQQRAVVAMLGSTPSIQGLTSRTTTAPTTKTGLFSTRSVTTL
jgi:hypothetical protein